MATRNIRYNLEEWQLFIDSFMHCLKAVLLDKGNILPSNPVACTNHKREKYENVKEILSFVNYKTFQWQICGDLKVSAIFMGLHKPLCSPIKMAQKNSTVSYVNVIVVPKVVMTPRKTSLYVNHIHLK
jgi:hypothetical protein